MRFVIAGFTHRGTEQKINQDRILIQKAVLSDGQYEVQSDGACVCFVADGIGGGPAGERAAEFVLEKIAERLSTDLIESDSELKRLFADINEDLFAFAESNPECKGCGTTLVGAKMVGDDFNIINAGDSPAYLYRNESMIKITEDQVLDPFEENSPITSYFGGKSDQLKLSLHTTLREIKKGDLLMLMSDGLLKALKIKQIKAILSNSKSLGEKVDFILKKALTAGAEDNVSYVLIEIH